MLLFFLGGWNGKNGKEERKGIIGKCVNNICRREGAGERERERDGKKPTFSPPFSTTTASIAVFVDTRILSLSSFLFACTYSKFVPSKRCQMC